MFSPLSGMENTIDSLDSGILLQFSPLFTSSPSQPSRKNSQTSNRSKSKFEYRLWTQQKLLNKNLPTLIEFKAIDCKLL